VTRISNETLFPEYNPELAGIMEDVLANPKDDTPRLVAADWWEEHGEPERALLVRLQLPQSPLRREHRHLNATNAHALLTRHSRLCHGLMGHLWVASIREVIGTKVTALYIRASGQRAGMWTIVWRRGFVEEVACSTLAWLSHGADVVWRNPVAQVRLTDKAPMCGAFDNTASWLRPAAPGVWQVSVSELPEQLYDLLDGGLTEGNRRRYALRKQALAALSDAALRLARNATVT
jgi:uncharacterized protein (TIGR02996 family)